MFCDEAIKNVYRGLPEYGESEDYFFDCYFDMAIHLTRNTRLVFECDTCFISLESDGVFEVEKKGDVDTIKKEGEYLESFWHNEDFYFDEPFEEYEYTLMKGEKIIEVVPRERGWIIRFTDFELNFVFYPEGEEVFRFFPVPDTKVIGAERLIKKCSCGGTGILETAVSSDYGITCDKCHRMTSAAVFPAEAIEEWNDAGEFLTTGSGENPSDDFLKYITQNIDYIVFSQRDLFFEGDMFFCGEIIVKVCNKMFVVGSPYCGGGNYDFTFGECNRFNREEWRYLCVSAEAEPIRFIGLEDDHASHRIMKFRKGSEVFTIISKKDYLSFRLPQGFSTEK